VRWGISASFSRMNERLGSGQAFISSSITLETTSS